MCTVSIIHFFPFSDNSYSFPSALPPGPRSLCGGSRILTPPTLTPQNWPVIIFQTTVVGTAMGLLVQKFNLELLLNQFRKRSPSN